MALREVTGEIPEHTEAVNSLWNVVLPLYLGAGVIYALVNMRSSVFSASQRSLEQHRLGWTVFPMMILSAGLWPIWLLAGYIVKWWILRKLDQEQKP